MLSCKLPGNLSDKPTMNSNSVTIRKFLHQYYFETIDKFSKICKLKFPPIEPSLQKFCSYSIKGLLISASSWNYTKVYQNTKIDISFPTEKNFKGFTSISLLFGRQLYWYHIIFVNGLQVNGGCSTASLLKV